MHQEGPIIFETARLVVRQYRPDDQENFFAMNGDEEIVRYIRPAKTKEESDIFLAEVIGYYFENPLYGRWAVNEKQTGNFVGTFALIPIEKTSKMQLGYSLLKPAWGQGYATELTKAGLMYVFSKTPLSEIWGITEAGNIPSQKPESLPDLTEPRQEQEKRARRTDSLANRPAIAFAWHMPERNSPEYYAMGLINQILLEGNDSHLYQALVQQHGLTGNVSGGINLLGNMFNYSGPMLLIASAFYDDSAQEAQIIAVVDSVVNQLQNTPVDSATLQRAVVKARSNLYDHMGSFYGFGVADLLAAFALFDDDPARINEIEEEFRKVTPELIQRTAREYLRTGNRTVYVIDPAAAPRQEATP